MWRDGKHSCDRCGVELDWSKREDARYCTDRCRMAHRREQARGEAVTRVPR